MAALRCSICAFNWPHDKTYRKCPSCLEPTDAIGNTDPMDAGDARSLRLNFEFERYYEEWEATQPPLEERCTLAASSTP